MTSSLTLWSSELDDWSVGVCGVVGTGGVEGIGSNTSMGSLLRDATALWPMVGRLLVRGTGSKLIAQVGNANPYTLSWVNHLILTRKLAAVSFFTSHQKSWMASQPVVN